jgi:hypothetical protein
MISNHGSWTNPDASCDCEGQNKLWRLFDHSWLEKRFWYINSKECLSKETIQQYYSEIIKIQDKKFYDGMDCILAYGHKDDKKAIQKADEKTFMDESIVTGIFFAKTFLKKMDSVAVFSFDYIMSNLSYTTETFPKYLQFYKEIFSTKKVLIIYGVGDSLFINPNAMKWFCSLILQRKNLTILTFQRGSTKVGDIFRLDKFFIECSYGIFQQNVYRTEWTNAWQGNKKFLIGD